MNGIKTHLTEVCMGDQIWIFQVVALVLLPLAEVERKRRQGRRERAYEEAH